jgi:hypothetical protein
MLRNRPTETDATSEAPIPMPKVPKQEEKQAKTYSLGDMLRNNQATCEQALPIDRFVFQGGIFYAKFHDRGAELEFLNKVKSVLMVVAKYCDPAHASDTLFESGRLAFAYMEKTEGLDAACKKVDNFIDDLSSMMKGQLPRDERSVCSLGFRSSQ